MIETLCECNSLECEERVSLSVEESIRKVKDGFVLIAKACKFGKDVGDVLVEQHDTYDFYRSASPE